MNSKARLLKSKIRNTVYRKFPTLISLRLPRLIALEATNRCNLKCLSCPIPDNLTRKRGDMSLETFRSLLKQLTWKIERMNWNYGGEPLLNENLFKMISLAQSERILSKVDTNGMALNQYISDIFESGLYILNVALESDSEDQFRIGYDKNRVTSAVSEISRFKKSKKLDYPIINMNFIVKKSNEKEIDEAVKLSKNIGADFIVVKSLNINPGSWMDREKLLLLGNRFVPTDHPELSRYIYKDGEYVLNGQELSYCTYLSNSVTITWDGRVLPCCFDFDAEMKVGNINYQSIKDIWRSKKFKQMRKQILDKKIDICKNCTPYAPQQKIKLNK